jgi:hypothetical protein
MRNLIIILALIISGLNLSAQENVTQERRLLMKTTPTELLVDAATIGFEYYIRKNQTIEVEYILRNLNPEKVGTWGSVSYDYNNYHEFSSRYKFLKSSQRSLSGKGLFNGAYFAPGLKGGNRRNTNKEVVNFIETTADIGLMIETKSHISIEAFMGIGLRAQDAETNIQYGTTERIGIKIGLTL